MRLRNDQLPAQLNKSLAPVYLLSGDEPLQLGEAADQVRQTARSQGFSERELLEVGPGFDWNQLLEAGQSLSLFGDKRLLDLRLSSSKIGTPGSKAISAYLADPPPDTLLLITAPKLDRAQQNSKWVKGVERLGVLVQIWPIEGQRLLPWLERRLRDVGLTPEPGVVEMLSGRIEGNLLAAKQEIEKLLLLHGPGVVDQEQLAESVADSARFDVFGLVDALLAGEAGRGLRMLEHLQAEGVVAPVVLWALAREIRALAEMAAMVEQGRSVDSVMAAQRVWEKRKPLMRKGLKRRAAVWRRLLIDCAGIDRVIKGLEKKDAWLRLQDVALGIAGVNTSSLK